MKKITMVVLAAILSGCAGAQVKKLKSDIAMDLNVIAQAQDCESTCAQLKQYIATRLGQ